jgi:5-methylcytosine-specific restriction enzyme subunit McrC
MKKQFGQVIQLECRYDEYESNTPDNQVLALALKVADRHVKDPTVKAKVRRQLTYFQESCDPTELDWRLFRANASYNRLNEHYRPAHELSWFILDRFGLQDILKLGRTNCFSFLLDMNLLFEQFIGKVLARVCSREGLKLQSQARNRSIIWAGQKPYRDVIPDFLVEETANKNSLPIDAKYKLYQDKKVSNADIYQTFLYAFAFNWQADATTIRRALLIHPVARKELGVNTIEVRSLAGITLGIIRVLGVYLPDLIEELKYGKFSAQSSLTYNQIQAGILG